MQPHNPRAEGRCGSCRHWDQQTPQSSWWIDIRLADRPDETYEARAERQRQAENLYGQCQVIKLLDSYEPVEADALPLAFCKDGSDYKADLYTKAEFGCPMWEATDG